MKIEEKRDFGPVLGRMSLVASPKKTAQKNQEILCRISWPNLQFENC